MFKLMNLEDFFTTQKTLIEFEEKMASLSKAGEIRGPVHFVKGNEEQIIRIFRGIKDGEFTVYSPELSREEVLEKKLIVVPNTDRTAKYFQGIKEDDFICVSYRNHPHALLKGMPMDELRQHIVEGRSMYPLSKKHNIFTSAIVPGHLKPAVGIAMAYKYSGSKNKVWAFCGDMAAETGTFHECSKYAANFDLPITFVIEDNGISVETPTREVWRMSPNKINHLLPNTIYYVYTNSFKHQGAGREVGF